MIRRRAGVGLLLLLLALAPMVPVGADAAVPQHHAVQVTEGTFADPGFAHFGKYYYLYATGSRFPVLRATSPSGPYSKATEDGRALESIPPWVGRNPRGHYGLWAPSVFALKDAYGSLYVMYFAGFSARRNRHCVGVATSRRPYSGFTAVGGPICAVQRDHQAIDPTSFRTADGQRWIVFKTTFGNRRDFRIQAVRMGALGTTPELRTRRTLLASPREKMEGPSLIHWGDRVMLFLSGGNWATCSYHTDAWSAPSFAGKYRRVGTVMSAASTGMCGPGGATVLRDHEVTRIAFHTYLDRTLATRTRPAWVGELRWTAGRPHLY